MKIAMWSGPRNLSTAMMYAFGNRADCEAIDEPFYAAYLARTGIVHPMNEAILVSQPKDAEQVIADLTGTNRQSIQYQKHMTHHMDSIPLEWLVALKNVFLIRHPARVIASYAAKRENPTLLDLGFQQQAALYDYCTGLGQTPVVIDSDDILENPDAMLKQLCAALGIDFDPAMLTWDSGPKSFDGVWADHWYDSVHRSTGLKPQAAKPLPELPAALRPVYDQALPVYETLKGQAIG